MESMSVRPEQVTALSENIRTGATSIRSELEQLDQKVATLRGQWGGEAQVSYDQAQRKWNASLGELQQLLEKIARSTQEISNGYTSTDNKASQRFSI
ncbi:WXG100 family type VII secretion target [Demequina aurantiaca]|uniref:WXG100 family type VII secretion target n=1 Tax=Demequina aurantiaca TaxID=676200 RepID=UPI003D33780D